MFLSIVGPGLITANIDNDAGGIATYSLAGAQFGYVFLWLLIPVTFALIVIQEMCVRLGVITGKGLADLIRERFGVRITLLMMIGLLLANLFTTVAEFAGVAASAEVFHWPRYVVVVLAAAAVSLLVLRANYKVVEKIFLLACIGLRHLHHLRPAGQTRLAGRAAANPRAAFRPVVRLSR